MPSEVDLIDAVFDSELQAELCRVLDGERYRVVPHYLVGGHAIDVVVLGTGNARVGILCDGGRALPDDDIQGVLEHQMILERLGWKLIRVRASEYFRDPKKELERLRRRLGARGIKPVDAEPSRARGKAKDKDKAAKPADAPAPSLRDRVVQRAESIRSRWQIALPARPVDPQPAIDAGLAD